MLNKNELNKQTHQHFGNYRNLFSKLELVIRKGFRPDFCSLILTD